MNLIKKIINYFKYGKKKFFLIDEVDENNFGSDAIYTPVKEDLVEQDFVVYDPIPQDQLDSDFCAGFSGAYAAEATEGLPLSGAFLFAMAKKLTGDWTGWGTSILKICKARQKFGVCRKELYEYKRGWRNWFANWLNVKTEAYADAANHKSQAYFQVKVPYGWDLFDALRATLWHFKDKKVLIQTGRDAHATTLTGYSVANGIMGRDSYGTRTYKDGVRYFPRWYANGLFTPYFAIDMPRELAEILVEYMNKAIKLKDKPECYLVRNGEKHLLANEAVAWSHNTLLFDPNFVFEVSQENFDKIPTGAPAKFDDGQNQQIVRRILEKLNRIDLIVN